MDGVSSILHEFPETANAASVDGSLPAKGVASLEGSAEAETIGNLNDTTRGAKPALIGRIPREYRTRLWTRSHASLK